jgi:uncharacterized damage-inducible protein DinB
MTVVAPLTDLYQHMEWADSMVWAAVRAIPAAEHDRRMGELLQHMHMVQRAFYAVWRREPLVRRGAGDFESLWAIEAWGREYYSAAHAYLATLADSDLDEVLTLPWASMLEQQLGRPPGETTLGDTILQVASHTTYHRGQVNVKIRDLGGEPPLVDYIAWRWFGRPAAVWSQPV